jgi:hypothetical protein
MDDGEGMPEWSPANSARDGCAKRTHAMVEQTAPFYVQAACAVCHQPSVPQPTRGRVVVKTNASIAAKQQSAHLCDVMRHVVNDMHVQIIRGAIEHLCKSLSDRACQMSVKYSGKARSRAPVGIGMS